MSLSSENEFSLRSNSNEEENSFPSQQTSIISTRHDQIIVNRDNSDEQEGKEKKRKRRSKAEIKREFICQQETCKKAYGSEGALRNHFKHKHQSFLSSSSLPSSPSPSPSPSSSSFFPLNTTPSQILSLYHKSKEETERKEQKEREEKKIEDEWNTMKQKEGGDVERERVIFDKEKEREKEKIGGTTVPVLMCQVGSWRKISNGFGDILLHFNFAQQNLCLEVAEGNSRFKIQSYFDHVYACGIHLLEDSSCVFTLHLAIQPTIFSSPLYPSSSTSIHDSSWDLSGGNLLTSNIHTLHFRKGELTPSLSLLFKSHPRLAQLASKGLSFQREGTKMGSTSSGNPFLPSSNAFFNSPPQSVISVSPLPQAFYSYSFNGNHYQNSQPVNYETKYKIEEKDEGIGLGIKGGENPQKQVFELADGEKDDSFSTKNVCIGKFEEDPSASGTAIQFLEKYRKKQSEFDLCDCANDHMMRDQHWITLLKNNWNKGFRLECCGQLLSFKELLGIAHCNCNNGSFYYSFCWNEVVPASTSWHCKSCASCKEQREWHCNRCNRCSFGRSIPCQHCAGPERRR